MRNGLRSPLLIFLLLLSTLSVVLSLPPSLDPRDDICDPNECDGTVDDNDGNPSYECSGSSKRVRIRSAVSITVAGVRREEANKEQRLNQRETACIALNNCPGQGPEPQRINCKNCAKISKAKDKFDGCDPADSKGYKSSHNCDGSSYLCVHDGKAQCYSKASMKKLGAENGECFQ